MTYADLDKYIWLSGRSFEEGMASRDEQVHSYAAEVADDPIISELNALIAKYPDDPSLYLKKGIALSRGHLQHQQAIAELSYGLMLEPDNPLFYRWRGHKYLNVREFNAGRADLEYATHLDASNWESWYHLALGHYFAGDLARAQRAFERCHDITDDNGHLISVIDWLVMTLMRAGDRAGAQAALELIPDDLTYPSEPWSTECYFRRIQLYKGRVAPETFADGCDPADADYVTLGYGLGNFYYWNGEFDKARAAWANVVAGEYWSAFGYIAAEVDLANLDRADA